MALTIVYTNTSSTTINTSQANGGLTILPAGSVTLTAYNPVLDYEVAAGLMTRTVNGVPDNSSSTTAPATLDRSTSSTTILSGTSVTTTIDLSEQSLLGFTIPSAWTTAALSIEVSTNGSEWCTPYDSSGSKVGVIDTPSVNSAYGVDIPSFLAWRFIRFRSGVLSAAVNQAADRVIKYVTRDIS